MANSRTGIKPRGRRGIQSVEVGGRLLHALAHHGRAMALKDLAADAGMTAAKAHPYLVSFGHIGLVEQDGESGRYALGPLALQLGLISLQQADPVRVAAPLLPELAARTGHTVALVVWGGRGPTIVLREASPSAVHVDMRHGTVFSIAGTASGRLFAAHLAADVVRPIYEAERKSSASARAGGNGVDATVHLPAWRCVRGRIDRGAAPRPRPLGGRRGGRRQRAVGAGVRSPRRDGARAHRHRPIGGIRCALDRSCRLGAA